MSGLFSSLNTANKGLIAQQTSLHTVGHNIANANTRGYSRQRVNLQADRPYKYTGVGQLGTGVRMTSIDRSVDEYVNRQVRNEVGTLSKFLSRSEVLGQIEMIFNEPSKTGLNHNLGEMFTSWTQLSENPELDSARSVVVEKSRTLGDTITDMSNRLHSIKEGIQMEMDGRIEDFNKGLEQLETLNKEIAYIGLKGDTPNDLLDQRDLLLSDMASIADIEVEFHPYDKVSVSLGGKELLNHKDGQLSGLKLVGEEINLVAKVDINNGNKGSKIEIKSGSLKGDLEGLEDTDRYLKDLKVFSKNMAKSINLLYNEGEDKGEDEQFFIFKEEKDNHFSLVVNEKIANDPTLLKAGHGDKPAVGDGSKAQAISRLRDSKLAFDKDPVFTYNKDTRSIEDVEKGKNIRGQYGSMITSLGIDKKYTDDMIDNQLVVAQQLLIKKESVSGVSLNEEISDMIKFQQAYNANAKVISVIADMIDTLVNRTGV